MHHKSIHHYYMKSHPHHDVDEKTRDEILNQNVWKLFIKLAIPAILAMLMYSIYIFIDAIFVGQWVGKEGIAAISIVIPLTLINQAISSFMGVGFASVLSRAIGSRDEKTIQRILGNNTMLIFIFSAIFTVLGYIFANQLIGFLGATGEILELATGYFRIVVLGSFLFNFVSSSSMLVLAEGKTKVALVIIATGSMLNIILDPIFIRVLGMGVIGAGIATVIAMFVASIITFIYFLRGNSELSYNPSGFRLSPQLIRTMAPVGVSGMAMQLAIVIEQFIIYRSIGTYGGGDEIALMGATLNMLSFAIIPIFGISQGLQPVIGMNCGAKKFDRIKEAYKKFVIAATGIVFIIWGAFMLFPKSILGLYITDPELAASGANIFRILMSMFFLHGFILLSTTFFQAMGKGGIASFLLIARQVIIFAPIVLVLPIFMGLSGIWISLPISDILIVIVTLVFILREFRSINKSILKLA